MRNHRKRTFTLAALALLLAATAAAPPAALTSAPPPAQKMRPEEVIAKHLEAIGAPDTLASVKSRLITGQVVATFRSPGTGQVGGNVALASEGEKNVLGMAFENVTNYPQDKIGYDGGGVSASYVRPGVRTTLGDFLLTNKSVVKEGLIGGALSQAWPLLNVEAKKAKVEYSGRKKLGERQVHELKYFPRGGSDLRITMFFDAETFQHVRTEYQRTATAQMGSSPEASATRSSETRYKMVEEYSDFRKESGLTLPHVYKLSMEISAPTGSFKADWEMTLAQFAFNQNLDPKVFDVDGN